MEKFNNYTFGHHTIVLSDHKPLPSLVLSGFDQCTTRLQYMLLRLQKYNISIIYHKGSEIILTDNLSRNLDTKSSEEPGKTSFDGLSIANIDLMWVRSNWQESKGYQNRLWAHTGKKLVITGWLGKQTKISEIAIPYLNFRDEHPWWSCTKW